MATVKLDGLEIDLPAEAASAVQSFARDMGRQLASATNERDELKQKLDSLQADLDSAVYEKEAAEGRADALEERVTELESGDGARIDTADIDQLVVNRLATLQHLAPAFEEDFKFDGIDDESLYAQAFENLTGNEPPEDADPTYVAGVVDGILSHFDADDDEEDEFDDEDGEEVEDDDEELDEEDDEPGRSDSTDSLRSALRGAGQGSRNPVSTYRARLDEAWKRPLTATK